MKKYRIWFLFAANLQFRKIYAVIFNMNTGYFPWSLLQYYLKITGKEGTNMRLEKIQNLLEEKSLEFQYNEVDGCGSLDFDYRGVPYHIWEYQENGWGVETNVKHGGYNEDITGDYEEEIFQVMKDW